MTSYVNLRSLSIAMLFVPLVLAGPSPLIGPAYVDPLTSVTADWRVEPVIFHGGSAPPEIALDATGRPYVLACPPGEVRHAVRERGAWTEELVTETVGGGICGALAVAPEGTAYVNFHIPPSGMPSDHRFAVREDTWQFFSMAANAADLAVDSRGVIHGMGWRAGLLTHMVWQSGAWTLESTGLTGSGSLAWTSMTLDARDNPHVLFYTSGEGDVRYGFRDDTGWHVEVVEHIGALNAAGRHGSLTLDLNGNPRAAYVSRTQPTRLDTFYAVWTPGGWAREFVANGYAPSLGIRGDGVPVVAYKTGFPGMGVDIATRAGDAWISESAPDPTRGPAAAQFPAMVLDLCDNPHMVWYDFDVPGVLYATKGVPCEARGVRLDVDPDTLNLKSRGRWVTAYVEAENASVSDLDPGSLRLNGIAATWTRIWDGALIAKFDRQTFAATVQPGEAVVVVLTGAWKDGGTFAAADTIRVIRPGR